MAEATVVGYTRLSQESDRSIESQKEDIRAFCEEQDWELVKIFDEGEYESGYDTEREEYQRMLEYVHESDVDKIVVRDRARLSRDRFDRLTTMLELYREKVEVVSIQGDIDLESDFGLVLEAIDATTDDVKKRQEIEKAKKEIQKRKEQGYYHGRPLYGTEYDSEKQYLVPDENWDTVQQILELREQGHSYSEIVEAVDKDINRTKVYRVVQRREKYEEVETRI